MTQVTGRWRNQYAYEARRPKVLGLYLGATNGKYPAWHVYTGRYGSEQSNYGYFGFSKYGSGAGAYRAATEFLLMVGRIGNTRTQYKKRERAGRTTGLPIGVHSIMSKNNSLEYVATICQSGMRMRRSFSIAKYGEEQAKAMAIAQRKAWEEEFALIPPEQPVVSPIRSYESRYEAVSI